MIYVAWAVVAIVLLKLWPLAVGIAALVAVFVILPLVCIINIACSIREDEERRQYNERQRGYAQEHQFVQQAVQQARQQAQGSVPKGLHELSPEILAARERVREKLDSK